MEGEINVLDSASLSTVLCPSMYSLVVAIWFYDKTKLKSSCMAFNVSIDKEVEKLQNTRKRSLILKNAYFNACTCKAIQSMKPYSKQIILKYLEKGVSS